MTSELLKAENMAHELKWETLPNENDRTVWDCLKEHAPITRPDIVKITEIPRSTAYDALDRLIVKGLVRKYNEKRNTPGRPKVLYDFNYGELDDTI